MGSGIIIESVKDALAVSSTIIESAEREIAWLVPAPMLVMAAQYDLLEKSKVLMQKGGRVRGITTISLPYVKTVRELLDSGEDVRDVQNYTGTFMLVGDNKQSISSMQVSVEDLSLDGQIVALWSEDPDYAAFLLSNFESAWTQGVDAKKHISELLKEGTSQA